jgi:hypothetical protein
MHIDEAVGICGTRGVCMMEAAWPGIELWAERNLSSTHEVQLVSLLLLWYSVVGFVRVVLSSKLEQWPLKAYVFVEAFYEHELVLLLRYTRLV